jgi:hypothetical protein
MNHVYSGTPAFPLSKFRTWGFEDVPGVVHYEYEARDGTMHTGTAPCVVSAHIIAAQQERDRDQRVEAQRTNERLDRLERRVEVLEDK